VAFCILYICNYMGVRSGWEGPMEGQDDHEAKMIPPAFHLRLTFGLQFVYLIVGNLSIYNLVFQRNIFIKHYVSFDSIKKRRETFNESIQLVNNNHVTITNKVPELRNIDEIALDFTCNGGIELNNQEILVSLNKKLTDYMMQGYVYNNNNNIETIWNPLSKFKRFECCSKTNDKLRKNFKNQSLPFKMFVGFHILTFIVIYILIIVGQDKWFSTKGNRMEIDTFTGFPPMLTPKMIDYDNEFISVLVWTGYIGWLGMMIGGVGLIIWWISVLLGFLVIIPILDILWLLFDYLICYFSPSARDRLVKRKNSNYCGEISDAWLGHRVVDWDVRKKAEIRRVRRNELENWDSCRSRDPVLKINGGIDYIFVNKHNKDILKSYFKSRYGRNPITWGRDVKTNDVVIPTAPILTEP
jgi:hypothetical protein